MDGDFTTFTRGNIFNAIVCVFNIFFLFQKFQNSFVRLGLTRVFLDTPLEECCLLEHSQDFDFRSVAANFKSLLCESIGLFYIRGRPGNADVPGTRELDSFSKSRYKQGFEHSSSGQVITVWWQNVRTRKQWPVLNPYIVVYRSRVKLSHLITLWSHDPLSFPWKLKCLFHSQAYLKSTTVAFWWHLTLFWQAEVEQFRKTFNFVCYEVIRWKTLGLIKCEVMRCSLSCPPFCTSVLRDTMPHCTLQVQLFPN